MWNRFTELGLGQAPQVGFPGAPGRLRPWERWRLIEKATMAYGYGLSVSLLQVARAYTVFARNGDMVSMTLVKRDSDPTSVRIYTPKTTALVRGMLKPPPAPGHQGRASARLPRGGQERHGAQDRRRQVQHAALPQFLCRFRAGVRSQDRRGRVHR